VIWLADLHQLSDIDSKYIISFIDEKSRKRISYWFLTDKKPLLTCIALENALQKANSPNVFGNWTDNGT
jgi:hypothetical protein